MAKEWFLGALLLSTPLCLTYYQLHTTLEPNTKWYPAGTKPVDALQKAYQVLSLTSPSPDAGINSSMSNSWLSDVPMELGASNAKEGW
eukprot:SAG22_NODE_15375_length_350_cov_0.812749_1_plen_87_part_01